MGRHGGALVSLAFVFPGQGSQTVGMGVQMAARWPSAARRFEEASEVLGYDLLEACREGPEERLANTAVAQPALYVTGYATQEILAAGGIVPSLVAGHSLGEYTACAAAGALGFSEGLRAVKARGETMREAGDRNAGGMLAVMGAKSEQVEAWVKAAAAAGVVVVANRNAPGQLIVSGEPGALDLVEKAGTQGGAKVVRLKVSGAFHSPLMKSADETMRGVLAGMTVREPAVPLAGNVRGSLLRTAGEIRVELEAQLSSPVLWEACVRAMAAEGVSRCVECGPGRVLGGLVRKTERAIKCSGTGSVEEIETVLAGREGVSSGAA